MQKPPFCTPKTILLHGKNHAFVLRTCNIHRMNTLRTFREYPHSPTKTPNLHPAKYQRTPPKHPTYTPPGVGAIHRTRILTLSNPYFHIIKYTYSFHRKHISTLSNTHIRFIANAFLFPILWAFTDMRAR